MLSKALRYADDVKLIDAPRKVGLLKVERPEIECWELEQYPRILEAARKEVDEAKRRVGEYEDGQVGADPREKAALERMRAAEEKVHSLREQFDRQEGA